MGTCAIRCVQIQKPLVDQIKNHVNNGSGGMIKHITKTKKTKSQASCWDSIKVAAWLELLGLAMYEEVFLEHGVDGATLLELSEDQITRAFNIKKKTHITSLLWAIHDLKFNNIDYHAWEWTCMGVRNWLNSRGLNEISNKFYEEAVHGGVLFRMTKEEFVNELAVGQNSSPLVIVSLLSAIRHAEEVGNLGIDVERVSDWGPQEVYEWLCSLHLPHLKDCFEQHCIHGTLLLELNQDILQTTMQLSEIQAMVIYKGIRKLRKRDKRNRKGLRGDIHECTSNASSDMYSDYSSEPGFSAPPGTQLVDYNDWAGVQMPTDKFDKNSNHHRSHSVPTARRYSGGPEFHHRKTKTQLFPHPEASAENLPMRANVRPVKTDFSKGVNSLTTRCVRERNNYFDRFVKHPNGGDGDETASSDGSASHISMNGGPGTAHRTTLLECYNQQA